MVSALSNLARVRLHRSHYDHVRYKNMKKCISLLLSFGLLSNICLANDWTEKYTPTRAEWLQHDLERNIRTSTDLWRIRVAVNVLIFPQSKEVLIIIASANGQQELTGAVCSSYRSTAENIAKLTLEEKSWSAGGKIQSKCV